MHVGLAVMILLGGPERFTPPTYQPLLDYTHNATWPWALWIGTSALFMLSRRPWISIIGLWLGMVWHVVWMSSFVIAMGNSLTAASTPIPMHGAGALICTVGATAGTGLGCGGGGACCCTTTTTTCGGCCTTFFSATTGFGAPDALGFGATGAAATTGFGATTTVAGTTFGATAATTCAASTTKRPAFAFLGWAGALFDAATAGFGAMTAALGAATAGLGAATLHGNNERGPTASLWGNRVHVNGSAINEFGRE